MVNYYKILELENYVSVKEVKQAYKKLVRIYHPDIYPGADGEEITKYLNQAKDIIGNEAKKQAYDEQLRLAYTYEEQQSNRRKPKPSYWQSLSFAERKKRKEEARKLKIKEEYLASTARFPIALRWIGIILLILTGLQLVYSHYFVLYHGFDLFYIIVGTAAFVTGVAVGANELYTYFTVKSVDQAMSFNYERNIAWAFAIILLLGPFGIIGLNEYRKSYLLDNHFEFYWAHVNQELSKQKQVVYTYFVDGKSYTKSANVERTMLVHKGDFEILIRFAKSDPKISEVIFEDEIPELARPL
ncbi:MAG: hypothetical protein RLZZ337_914 [Bacteroidota bacterium]